MVRQAKLGVWRGVSIEVAVWDGVMAAVELSCACMASREGAGGGPSGGLAHLDTALSGALTAMRAEGYFKAEAMDALLLANPPPRVAAGAVLVIGLGEPQTWTAAVSARAAACGVRMAVQLGKRSAAFAPSMLDEALDRDEAKRAAPLMMAAVAAEIDCAAHLAKLGFAPPPSLERWVFDVGAPRFEAAARSYQQAFAELPLQG